MERADVAVVGGGFGGLAAALELAEQGLEVVIFERLTYPGGCASTFERHGWRFESGATLFAGLGEDQLFGRWIAEYDLPVEVHVDGSSVLGRVEHTFSHKRWKVRVLGGEVAGPLPGTETWAAAMERGNSIYLP
ncbi:MAG: FAD-dependent oxidoreductase, partial [Bradymonadaceae bacterium]